MHLLLIFAFKFQEERIRYLSLKLLWLLLYLHLIIAIFAPIAFPAMLTVQNNIIMQLTVAKPREGGEWRSPLPSPGNTTGPSSSPLPSRAPRRKTLVHSSVFSGQSAICRLLLIFFFKTRPKRRRFGPGKKNLKIVKQNGAVLFS